MNKEDNVILAVKKEDGNLSITKANMETIDVYYLLTYLVDRLSKATGQEYNDTLDDLKEVVKEEEGEKDNG
jgi:hypothetical protein